MSQRSESTCQRNQLVVHCRHIKPTGNLCKTLTVISLLLGSPDCSLAHGRGYVHVLCYGERTPDSIASAMSSWFVPAKEIQLGVSIPCSRYTEPEAKAVWEMKAIEAQGFEGWACLSTHPSALIPSFLHLPCPFSVFISFFHLASYSPHWRRICYVVKDDFQFPILLSPSGSITTYYWLHLV